MDSHRTQKVVFRPSVVIFFQSSLIEKLLSEGGAVLNVSEMDICNHINMAKLRAEAAYHHLLKTPVMTAPAINLAYFWNLIYIIYCVE